MSNTMVEECASKPWQRIESVPFEVLDFNESTVMRVERAAIRQGGTVYSVPRPGRHPDVIHGMIHICGLPRPIVGEQGFVLTNGQFVGRRAAKRIARKEGQLLPRASKLDELFSEDVW